MTARVGSVGGKGSGSKGRATERNKEQSVGRKGSSYHRYSRARTLCCTVVVDVEEEQANTQTHTKVHRQTQSTIVKRK